MIDALRCLIAVVEHRSLSRAAAQLEMAVSSVSRKLDALGLSMVGKSPRARWRFDGVNQNQPLDVKGALRCDDTDTLMHAAIAGAGLVHLANWMVSEAIVAGKLVPVFPMAPLRRGASAARHDPAESAVHAVHMPGRSNQAKSQLLISHLREYFGDPPYWDVAMEAIQGHRRKVLLPEDLRA